MCENFKCEYSKQNGKAKRSALNMLTTRTLYFSSGLRPDLMDLP